MQRNVTQIYRLIVQVAMLIALLMIVLSQSVAAHGADGVLQVTGVKVGPYNVDIWTTPGILRTGEIHVETAISNQGTPVTDCLVRVQITPPGVTSSLLQWASEADPDNGFRHEAAFRLENAGRYQVTVSVLDPKGGGGEMTFDIEVTRLPIWVQLLLHLLVGVSIVLTIWFIRRGFQLFLYKETNK